MSKPTPYLAQHIEVIYHGPRMASVVIDGYTLPWYLGEYGVEISRMNKDEIPSITITIVADRVTSDFAPYGVLPPTPPSPKVSRRLPWSRP